MTKDRHTFCTESIYYACCEGGFWTYYGEIHFGLFGKEEQALYIGVLDGYALSELSDTCIAWSAVNLLYLWAA
jgi:hypothetical protein